MTDRETLIRCLKYCSIDENDCLGCERWEYDCGSSKCVDNLMAQAAKALEQQQWIPVSERLPDNKEHDWVLAQVVEDNGYMHIPKVMEYRERLNDWYEETYGWLSKHNGAFIVTHWMPLPEPPKV